MLMLVPIAGVLPANAASELEPMAAPATGQINVAPRSTVPGFVTDVVYFVVVDANFEIVYESVVPSASLQLTVPAGEYYIAVFDDYEDDSYPFFPGLHDGTPIFSKQDIEPFVVTEGGGSSVTYLPMTPVFTDLWDSSLTFREAIVWLRNTGITQGCSEVLFCGGDYVTRGQMAAFLDRALDLPTGPATPFTDTAGSFEQNIRDLYAAGITTGCAPTRYCTNDYVTRGQMAAFLDRALDLPAGPATPFTDIAGTFEQNIADLYAAGITTGCAPTRYCTNDFVTREQMALFLERALADSWFDPASLDQSSLEEAAVVVDQAGFAELHGQQEPNLAR